MKKSLFFLPLAAAMMASCSNDDFDGTKDGYTGETEIHYLAVNIADVADNGTRADNTSGSDYENGTAPENEVTNIRFYLFNEDGTSFTSTPSVDATAEPVEGNTTNIEKKLQAVIVFSAEKSNSGKVATPGKIVAVLNPPTGLTTAPTNVETLQTTIADYQKNLTTAGTFVMSNSVYAEAGSPATEHVAYDITADKIKDSKAAALASPVEIYVERVVAKARVGIDTDQLKAITFTPAEGYTADNVYEITGEDEDGQTIYGSDGNAGDKKKIYVKLLGWNVTGTAPESRLVKKIIPTWGGENWLADNFKWGQKNEWNYPTFNRSFWALNPSSVKSQEVLQFGNFNGTEKKSNNDIGNLNPAVGNGSTSFDGITPIYMQENASWNEDGSNPGYGTKLIVAAQLVDEQGKGVQLGWYAGSYYMQDDLKQVVLNNAKIFKKSESGTSTTYTPVTTEDIAIKFITATEAGVFGSDGKRITGQKEDVNRYNSYAKAEAESITAGIYYEKKSTGTYEEITDINKLNEKLKAIGEVKVWESGYTYYWLDITHLAPAEMYGHVGIVRNHIYDYKLSKIQGFGIPVLDPKETIYPEEPNDPKMMYIAARINILSWRLVNHNNAQLGW